MPKPTSPDTSTLEAPPTVALKTIFVVLRDDAALNDEMIKVAYNMTRTKRQPHQIVALYGTEVPRTKRLEDDLAPEVAEHADEVAQRAAKMAQHLEADHFEAEIIKCRDFGHSVIDEIKSRDCALLIIGMPYRVTPAGVCQLDKTADYVLEHATCRVWIIRGEAKESAEK